MSSEHSKEFSAPKAPSTSVHGCNKCPYFTTSAFLMANHVKRHLSPLLPFNCENAKIEHYHCKDCDFHTEYISHFKQHIAKFHRLATSSGTNPSTETNTQQEINSVQYILKKPVAHNQKILIKERGRPTPNLNILCESLIRGRKLIRKFNKNIYDKYEWICGCPVTNKLYCFPCLLHGMKISGWTQQGVNNLKHLSEMAKKHQISVDHLMAYMDHTILGKADIVNRLDTTYVRNKLARKEEVEKNLIILRRLIMTIRFCGAFELSLNQGGKSDDTNIHTRHINFAAELDAAVDTHLKDTKINPKEVRSDLLDAMFTVYRRELITQIKSANFIALKVDRATNALLVVTVRYVFNGQLYERFWTFIKPEEHTAEELVNALLAELKHLISESDRSKLIAQSYDGTLFTSRVQASIKQAFAHAHFIHPHSQRFNLIEQVVQYHKKVKLFHAYLEAFSDFFGSSKRISVLDEVAKRRVPHGLPPVWQFQNRTANTLLKHKECFIECLEEIIDAENVDMEAVNEACILLSHLKSPDFLYWLKIFHFIMPQVEVFFHQIETNEIEAVQLQSAVEQFERRIMNVRACIDKMAVVDEETRDNEDEDTTSVIAKELCDSILTQIKERFDFKGHLSAAKLFESRHFQSYKETFPQEDFDATVKAYSMLDGVKLKFELATIYERNDMWCLEGILPLLVFLTDNNLKSVLSETYKLVDILCTTPMLTSERERCLPTLKRIKTFLRSADSEDGLNALAVLSTEATFVQCIPDFDNKVVEIFCSASNRRLDFTYQ